MRKIIIAVIVVALLPLQLVYAFDLGQEIRNGANSVGNAVGAGNVADGSWYKIINTTTEACSDTQKFPGGDVGLQQLQSDYKAPYFTVTYGTCDKK